ECYTHAAGQIVSITAPPTTSADQIVVAYGTDRTTASFTSGAVPPAHSGLYRNPLPLSNGKLLAVHPSEPRQDYNDGTRALPASRYAFRIQPLSGSPLVAGSPITGAGLTKSVSWYDPDVLVAWSGTLWEL